MLLGITVGCSAVRNLPEDGILLRKNTVIVDDQAAVDTVANIVQPKPNNRFLGIPFGLLLYQSAKDSTDVAFNNWLIKKPGRKKRMNAIWSEKQVKKMKAFAINTAYICISRHYATRSKPIPSNFFL